MVLILLLWDPFTMVYNYWLDVLFVGPILNFLRGIGLEWLSTYTIIKKVGIFINIWVENYAHVKLYKNRLAY
jgi:hypothetical protein